MPMHISHHTRITNIVIMALVISVMLAVTKRGRSKQLQVQNTQNHFISICSKCFLLEGVQWG